MSVYWRLKILILNIIQIIGNIINKNLKLMFWKRIQRGTFTNPSSLSLKHMKHMKAMSDCQPNFLLPMGSHLGHFTTPLEWRWLVLACFSHMTDRLSWVEPPPGQLGKYLLNTATSGATSDQSDQTVRMRWCIWKSNKSWAANRNVHRPAFHKPLRSEKYSLDLIGAWLLEIPDGFSCALFAWCFHFRNDSRMIQLPPHSRWKTQGFALKLIHT